MAPWIRRAGPSHSRWEPIGCLESCSKVRSMESKWAASMSSREISSYGSPPNKSTAPNSCACVPSHLSLCPEADQSAPGLGQKRAKPDMRKHSRYISLKFDYQFFPLCVSSRLCGLGKPTEVFKAVGRLGVGE